jgi:hypothetical protein
VGGGRLQAPTSGARPVAARATARERRNECSPPPGAVGATASGGAARRHIGVADAAFDQILGGERLSSLPLGALAPPELLAQGAADRLDAPDVTKGEPDDTNDGGENEELGEGKAEHGLV